VWPSRLDLHAQANAERSLWLDVELQALQVLHDGIGNLSDRNGLGVFNLVRGGELALVCRMAAVRAMTVGYALQSGPEHNLEITRAASVRALSADIAAFVSRQGYFELVAKITKVSHTGPSANFSGGLMRIAPGRRFGKSASRTVVSISVSLFIVHSL
jgi:hypothetical protein